MPRRRVPPARHRPRHGACVVASAMDWYVPLVGALWLFSGALIGYAAARLSM